MMNLNSKPFWPLAVFAVVMAAPLSALAQGMGKDMPTFAEHDLNGDGKIVEQEFNEARAKRISDRAQQGYRMRNVGNAPAFQQIDSDGDGAISAGEFSAHQSQRVPGR